MLLTASRIPICAACFASFEPIPRPICERCGKPFLTPIAAEAVQPRCRLCRDDFFAFDFARSYGVYNDALHHAILLLKYEEVTRLGDWFAARLAELVAARDRGIPRGRGGAGAVAPGPAARTRVQSSGADRASIGPTLASKAGSVPADAHQASSGATGALAQGALGVRTWRVRHP